MKKFGFIAAFALTLLFSACASDEEVLVQSVIGAYDCAYSCTEVDLRGINPDTTFSGQTTIFLKEAEKWEEGWIFVGETEVQLEADSSFTFSSSTLFLSGSLEADGKLVFSETRLDLENNIRRECEFSGFQK